MLIVTLKNNRSTFTELKRESGSVITAALYSRQTDGINGGHKSGNSLERGSAVHMPTLKGAACSFEEETENQEYNVNNMDEVIIHTWEIFTFSITE